MGKSKVEAGNKNKSKNNTAPHRKKNNENNSLSIRNVLRKTLKMIEMFKRKVDHETNLDTTNK